MPKGPSRLVPESRGESDRDGGVGPEKFQARAVVAEDAERDRLYAQHAATYPGFNEYQARTSRRIPVVLLERLP